ncbi:MAG: hypothetical protein IPO92_03860 [Saprospiraceae bacterium]|nr:hypothetical protein [Saprospiraceae bacterium]
MNFQSVFFIISISFVISCKNEGKLGLTDGNQGKVISNSYALLNQEKLHLVDITQMRTAANSVLEFRKKESNNKFFNVIEQDLWHFDAIVTTNKVLTKDSLDGKWIDFKADLTYDYGQYSDKKGSGKYFYDFDKATLLMIDDNEKIKPQEFEVNARNDMMILVGRSEYKDNNMQAKILRNKSTPIKKT